MRLPIPPPGYDQRTENVRNQEIEREDGRNAKLNTVAKFQDVTITRTANATANEVVRGDDSRLGGGGGGGGVTSLNALTGVLAITSTDSSVTIAAAGTSVNLSVPAGITHTETGICAVGGLKGGSPIDTAVVSNEVSALSVCKYNYPTTSTTWGLWVYPSVTTGIFRVNIRKIAAGSTAPGAGNSISGLTSPSIATGIYATGSDSTWTGSPINIGDMLTVVPVLNTAGVQWWALFVPLQRVL